MYVQRKDVQNLEEQSHTG